MVRRQRDLGRFTAWPYENAMVRMSGLGWRSGPETNAPKREESFVHARLLDSLGYQGRGSREFAWEPHLPLEDVCALIPKARSFAYANPIDKFLGHE